MVYIYSLPSETLQYPDVRNLTLKSYLNRNHIKYKYVDLVDYLINDILYKNKKIKKTIDDIRSDNTDLLESNMLFLKEYNLFLEKYNLSFHRNYSFNKIIKSIDDLIDASFDISKFIDLFKVDKYNNDDIIYLGVQYGYQLPFAICYAKKIKSINSTVKVILGGNYLTQICESNKIILEKIKEFDAIILFAHGISVLNLIKYYNNKKTILYNIIERNNKLILKNDIKDDYNDYSIDYSDIDLSRYLSKQRIMPVLLNYGCYHHKCSFCAHYYYYGNYMKLNTSNICNIILKEYNDNKFDKIVFLDECIPEKQILDVANFFIDKNINTIWMMETRISNGFIDEKKVRLLYDSGCRFVSFGIESYNKVILKKMNKNIDIKIVNTVLKNFFENGIAVSSTFMIGYPGENLFNIYKTLHFIKNNKYLDLFGLNVFRLARNSLIANNMNIKFEDNNLIYIYDNKIIDKILKMFLINKKISRVEQIKKMVLNRCDYLFINRNNYSMNFREANYEYKC